MATKKQKVADDQVENVGIMAGFMDELDDLMEEIDGEMEEPEATDESEMALVMSRRPDSPEILMNNLRGDFRSIDARREELADLVGYNAAAETPDEVLAMLQPVLAKQGVAALPQAAPMAPEMAMPAGIEALPAAQGPMPGAPMPEAPMPMAPQAPVGMKKGGIVQFFQDGGEPQADEYAAYPADVVAEARRRVQQMAMAPPETQALPDVGARTRELAPMYAEILGTQDKDAVRSQMLFDIAQAALGFAGNVSPQGQPLTGSFAARLAGAASGLPGQISARSQAMRAAETQARLAALQQAQGERTLAQESNLQREKDYRELLLKAAGQKSFRSLSADEKTAAGLPAGEPWQIDVASGQYSLPGGRAATTNINTATDPLKALLATEAGSAFKESRLAAEASAGTLRTIGEIRPLLEDPNMTFNGPLSGAEAAITRLAAKFGITEGDTQQKLNNTAEAMRGLAEFELQAASAMRGQGAITGSERELIRRASAGDLSTMSAEEVKTLVAALEKTAIWKIENYNSMLNRIQTEVGESEPVSRVFTPIPIPDISSPAQSGGTGTVLTPEQQRAAAAALENRNRPQ